MPDRHRSTDFDSVPPNVTFEIDDAEAEWAYKHKFDFIHARMLTGSFKNWPRFFKQSFEYD